MNYDRQLFAWSLDRALETLKLQPGSMHEIDSASLAEKALAIAEQYCAFIVKAKDAGEEEPQANDNVEGNA